MSSPSKVVLALTAAGALAFSVSWLGHTARAEESTTIKTESESSTTTTTTTVKTDGDSSELNWSRSLKATLEQAKTENKYVLVDMYTDWCGWCKVLDQKTFSDADMRKYLNDGFLCVKLDAEDGKEGTKVARDRDVNAYPTALVFAQDGKLIGKVTGFKAPREYAAALAQVIKHPDKSLDR